MMKHVVSVFAVLAIMLSVDAYGACRSCNSGRNCGATSCSKCNSGCNRNTGCNTGCRTCNRPRCNRPQPCGCDTYRAEPVYVAPVVEQQPVVVSQPAPKQDTNPRPYIALHIGADLLNWENKYTFDGTGWREPRANFSDKYSLEPVFGGDVALGLRLANRWRGDIEGGYLGRFKDSDDSFKFTMSAYYAMLNFYYEFDNGVYIGAGAGAASVETGLDTLGFLTSAEFMNASMSGGEKKRQTSLIAGATLGYAWNLSDNAFIDLRYRLSGFNGTKQVRDLTFDWDNSGVIQTASGSFENKIGLILNNSLSIGLRYEF